MDSFLSARKEINRLRTQHASPDWQQARIEGKAARRLETDTIKSFVEYAKRQGSSSPERYYQTLTKAVYGALFFVQGAVGNDFRSQLSAVQLASVAMAEQIIDRALVKAMAAKMFYKAAYKLADGRVKQFAAIIEPSVPGRSTLRLGA